MSFRWRKKMSREETGRLLNEASEAVATGNLLRATQIQIQLEREVSNKYIRNALGSRFIIVVRGGRFVSDEDVDSVYAFINCCS